MPEHYSASVLGRTKELYIAVKDWVAIRGDVTIVGGWAVYEHVESGYAMQSRDVDIVLHSEAALQDLDKQLGGWNLQWRSSGRKRFPDAHFRDEGPLEFRLDAFTTASNPTWLRLFGTQGGGNIKSCPAEAVPSLEWMIHDKLATIPLRRTADAGDKRAKDLIDVYNLLFHNNSSQTPKSLANQVPSNLRNTAAKWLNDAEDVRPEYRSQLATLKTWLAS